MKDFIKLFAITINKAGVSTIILRKNHWSKVWNKKNSWSTIGIYLKSSVLKSIFHVIKHFIICNMYSQRGKCPYSELFWSAFSRTWTEYGEILGISLYLVQMRGNADENNSEYAHFLRNYFCRVLFWRSEKSSL